MSYYDQYLDNCPYCNGEVKDKSYDRRVVFECSDCKQRKDYPGILQLEQNEYPVPYSDGQGGTLDPSKVKNQEYYHRDATEKAIKEFNDYVKLKRVERDREKKLKLLNSPNTQQNYEKYMNNLNSIIEETDIRIKELKKQKKISKLSYEEWVQWQDGEINID